MSTPNEGGCETEAEHQKNNRHEKPYMVSLWGSEPGTDDDCHTGDDFATLEEARAVYQAPFTHFKGPGKQSGESYYLEGGCWVELVGPGVVGQVRQLSKPSRKRDAGDEEWRREIATEAGMLGGCDAYNEVMGYD